MKVFLNFYFAPNNKTLKGLENNAKCENEILVCTFAFECYMTILDIEYTRYLLYAKQVYYVFQLYKVNISFIVGNIS